MGLRFRRSIKLGSGLRLNLSKSGLGVSAGVPGFRIGTGPRGSYVSAGIPGTGISSRQYLGSARSAGKGSAGPTQAQQSQIERTVALTSEYPSMAQLGFSHDHSALLFGAGILTLVLFQSVTGVLISLALVGIGLIQGRDRSVKLGHQYSRALTDIANGEFAGALLVLRQLEPETSSAEIQLALGHTYMRAGQYEEAVACYSRYAKQTPLTRDLTIQYATALERSGKPEEGLRLLEGLPGSPRDDLGRLYHMGTYLLAMDRIDQAIELLKEAPLRRRSPDPTLTAIRYTLGLAYTKGGDKRRGLACFHRVYADDPEFCDVQAVIAELESQPKRKRGAKAPEPAG